MPPMAGSALCWAHADDRHVQKQRDDARAAGGAARRLQLLSHAPTRVTGDDVPDWWDLRDVAEVRAAYVWLAQRLARREVDARSANAMAAVLHGLVNATRESEQEQRLGSLERAAGLRR